MSSVKTVNIILAVIIAFVGFLSSFNMFLEAVEGVMRMAVFFSIAVYILINNEEKA